MSVKIDSKDTDGDGVSDTIDLCPTVPDTITGNGCPMITGILGRLESNKCILEKAKTQ